ncbi:MAG TPA: hypothetical protein VGP18_01865 [Solirubrobacteraceae bacterium]|nr:hypothetical protein [Solirubrobacteraceae bacterium]
MIASVHLADVGKRMVLGLLPRKLGLGNVPGLHYAEVTIAAPLSAHLLPRPNLGRVGLIATWDDDRALDGFLSAHPFAEQLRHGWHVRLQPTRIFGAWPQMSGLLAREVAMEDSEPAAVLTIGRLRLSQTVRFLRASATAEELAVRNPSLLASTGLARPPALVSTFSLWQSTDAMRAYAQGVNHPGHLAAIRAHAAQPFHHESAFIRFRPYASEGSWNGRDPLG